MGSNSSPIPPPDSGTESASTKYRPALVISPNGDLRIEDPWPTIQKIECGREGGCTLTPHAVAGITREPLIIQRDRGISENCHWYGSRIGVTVAAGKRFPCSDEQIAARRAILASAKGQTNNRIATKTGIAQSSLSRWVRGLSSLSPESIQALADYLGIRPDQIPNDQGA